MQPRRVFLLAVTIFSALFFGLSACQQNGVTDPALASLSSSVANDNSTSSGTIQSDDSTRLSPFADILGGATPEAVLEVRRVPASPTGTTGNTTGGGSASARFDATLQIQGASVRLLGVSYPLILAPTRPQHDQSGGRPNGPGGHPGGMPPSGNPPSGNSTSGTPPTLFLYPAPPSSTATTTTPILLPLGTGSASVAFTATGYALSDNTIEVPGAITITSHSEGGTFQRSAALTVRWSASGAVTNGMVIVRNVADSTVLAGKSRSEREAYLKSLPKPISKKITAGSSSADFTAAEVATLQAGKAAIEVQLLNAKAINNNKAVLAGHSATHIRLTAQ